MVTASILGTDLRPRDLNPNPSPLVEMSHYYNGSFTLTDTKTKNESNKCTNVVTGCIIDIQSQYGDSVPEMPQDSVCVCV